MVAQAKASSTSRLSLSATPNVHPSADVHEFSLIEGNVQLAENVLVAPGTAVTAGQGASVFAGEGCVLSPGVLVEAVAGHEVQAAGGAWSVYLGAETRVAHKALVHSPAYVGSGCFIGFRSTIFNARLGDGCVVMMHALVQDVEIPPGRCVPSGSVITSQHQAEQLPKVRPEDFELAREVMGAFVDSTRLARSASAQPGNARQSAIYDSAVRQPSGRLVSVHAAGSPQYSSTTPGSVSASHSSRQFSHDLQGSPMQPQRLSPEIVQQVRQYLNQGYRIGMEHADKRRYRSGVWETCTPIKDTREQAVFEALERCLAEHADEYVRMFGIDSTHKRRVGMVTVKRPGEQPTVTGGSAGSSRSYSAQSSQSYGQSTSQSVDGLDAAIAQEVRSLLNAGYQIGTEHAGPRHYRSNVWKVCSPIESRNEREVFAKLAHCLDEHSGEYVRMFGINAQSKSRTSTTTIQRADGKPVEIKGRPVAAGGSSASGSNSYAANGYAQSSSGQNSEAAQIASQIIRSGNKVGIEFADKRRYRSGIWQTAPSISATSESSAVSQLQNFLSEHSDKYVRVFAVNSQTKTRGASTTIQKPGQKSTQTGNGASGSTVTTNGQTAARGPVTSNPPHYDDPAFINSQGQGSLDSQVLNQVTQLVNQGNRLSIEFADKRRYRSGIWKTGPSLSARRPAEAISELGKLLAQHGNDYVRLVGTDLSTKRRTAEITVQRPGQAATNGSGPINANPPQYNTSSYANRSSNGGGQSYSSNGSGQNGLASSVLDQVTQLVNQGHRISLEFADKRRFRSGIWKTGGAISARRPAEAISELGKQLARHEGEYVRLIGVDTQAKRRVLEETIQRP